MTASTEIYTLSLHDALPIYTDRGVGLIADTHIDGGGLRQSSRGRQQRNGEWPDRVYGSPQVFPHDGSGIFHSGLASGSVYTEPSSSCGPRAATAPPPSPATSHIPTRLWPASRFRCRSQWPDFAPLTSRQRTHQMR